MKQRSSCPAAGRKARCTVAENGIVGKYIGEPGTYTAVSGDFDSSSMISYKATGLTFTKKK